MRAETEVSNRLSGVAGTSEDQGVLTLGGSESQLVQGDGLTTGLDDLGLGTGSESQSGDGGLGELQQSVVVGNGTNNNDGLLVRTLAVEGSRDSSNGHGGSVDLRQEQRSQDDLVEGGVSSS